MTSSNELFHKARIIALVLLPLIGTIAAMVLLWKSYFHWRDLWILLGMYIITTIGVTIGYHRMLTHQGFKAPEWLRALFLIFGSMAYEGKPIAWVTTHIVHHAHSDEEGDPHSPIDGFWHAHIGWLFSPNNFPDPKIYAPHLLVDRTAVLIDRFVLLWMTLALVIPFLLGGWMGLLWGGAVRIFLTTHMTWSVNSICHTFGKRPFETTDESRNNWFVGLFGFGEGWHNNHHAFPRNAFHGLRWWQIDCTGLIIRLCEKLGLVWDVERVPISTIDAHLQKSQGMRSAVAALRQELLEKIVRAKEETMRMIDGKVLQAANEATILDTTASGERALQSLEDLHSRLLRSAHLRKQKILQYKLEVSELLLQLRKRTAPQLTL